MDEMEPKVKQWIDEKKDPRSARWQAGLEAVMELFLPMMEKGRLTPVCPLEKADLPIFKAALKNLDLSPGLLAAFLPPAKANLICSPDSAEELVRIEKEKPSYKIIIQRPGNNKRILCAEISEQAHRPGVDIFESGAFLGNFDYATQDICIMELTKIVRAHAWQKNNWQPTDYLAYTVNWFDKIVYIGSAEVSVDKNYSFFHSPTLVKMNRVDGLFLLLYTVAHHRFKEDPEGLYKLLPGADENAEPQPEGSSARQSLAETCLLDLLNVVRKFDLMDFRNFTNAESHEFTKEFNRTVSKLSSDLEKKQVG
jgi:hypothetical protein